MCDADSIRKQFKAASNIMYTGCVEVTVADSSTNSTSSFAVKTVAPDQQAVARAMHAVTAKFGALGSVLGGVPALGAAAALAIGPAPAPRGSQAFRVAPALALGPAPAPRGRQARHAASPASTRSSWV